MSSAEATANRRSALANVPNFISALRLPIAAAFFVIDNLLWRGILLFLGALTDALDGWLARRLGVESKAGAIMDPLFDKLFVVITLAAFLPGPYLGSREYLILVSRDLYVGAGWLVGKAMGVNVPAQSRPAGKLVTALQVVTLFVLLLVPERFTVFMVAVGAASAIAIIDYTFAGLATLRRSKAA
ncbi:MAG: CDP-alcohol phosphatidyltransferase family protein [Gemmatimonadota bacterium]|nr:MAG: CDP-alcohol phosphatidyltransferase family protein [Gemmatimonadota bacterium]